MSLISYRMESKVDPILTRFKIIKAHFINGLNKSKIARKFGSHRNTIWNIIFLFEKNAQADTWGILHKNKLSIDEIYKHFSFMKPKSRKPLSHKAQASPKTEKYVLKIFEDYKVGSLRMFTHISRLGTLDIYNLSLGKIKWIYKRNCLKVCKERSSSGRVRRIYDYKSLAPFEKMHYDTKHILDKKALPNHIYEKFKLNPDLPIYQWTFQDAYSRFRFLAYSNSLNATFWLYFLLFCLMFIRSLGVDRHITIWTDWWIEFFSASKKKEAEWNDLLSYLNTHIYCYESNKDIRKNLIERSHRTDDEEFYIPRWEYILDRESFHREARNRYKYFNFLRGHQWIEMNWKTPFEKLKESWVWNLKPLSRFPTLILEDSISDLMYHTKTIFLKQALDKEGYKLDSPKSIIDFKSKLNILNNIYAQNVLDYYLLS